MADRLVQFDETAQVTLLSGSSGILKQRATQQLIDSHISPEERPDALGVWAAQELAPQQFAAELNARSLLVTERVVIIRRVDDIKADDQRELARALLALPASTTVIMTCGETAKGSKPAVVKELKEAVEQAGQIVRITTPQKGDVSAWIRGEAERCGKAITPGAVELLRELTEDNVDMLASEVEKVATYVGDRREIEQADVQAVGSRSQGGDVFALVDAIGNRSPAQALRELAVVLPPGTVSGEAPGLLGMVSRQLRLVWQARVAARQGWRLDRTTEVPKELTARFPDEHNVVSLVRRQNWLGKKLTQQARKFTDIQLARALARVHQTDLAMKGQGDEQVDARLALETLLVELCQL